MEDFALTNISALSALNDLRGQYAERMQKLSSQSSSQVQNALHAMNFDSIDAATRVTLSNAFGEASLDESSELDAGSARFMQLQTSSLTIANQAPQALMKLFR